MRDLDLDRLGKLLGGEAHWEGADVVVSWGDDNMWRVRPYGDALLGIDMQGASTLVDLITKTPEWSLEHGFTTSVVISCEPLNSGYLLRTGFEEKAPGAYTASLKPGERMDEYRQWKLGKANEPGWHKNVVKQLGRKPQVVHRDSFKWKQSPVSD